jgi:hypothetical protein
MTVRSKFMPALVVVLAIRCASAPKPTAGSWRIRANAPAVVEGRVRDSEGRPVAGIAVRGIPRGKDIPWSPAATTDGDGRFRISLAAPGDYGFLLIWKGRVVITSNPRDPARLEIPLAPGEIRKDVELLFLRADWQRAMGEAEKPSSP